VSQFSRRLIQVARARHHSLRWRRQPGKLADNPPIASPRPSSTAWCQSQELSLSLYGEAQAMNQPRAELEFTNRGSRACQMYGWPTVQMLDRGDMALPTRAKDASATYVPGTQETPVVVALAPGGHAYFGVGWENDVAPGPCERPASLRITPPGQRASMTVDVAPAGARYLTSAWVAPSTSCQFSRPHPRGFASMRYLPAALRPRPPLPSAEIRQAVFASFKAVVHFGSSSRAGSRRSCTSWPTGCHPIPTLSSDGVTRMAGAPPT